MPDDRRYHQRGYQDADADARARREPPPAARPPAGLPLGTRSISRCAQCGARLLAAAGLPDACSRCGAAVHACKQCAHFDPGRRFECTEPVVERVADKVAANDCPRFSLRVVVERDAAPGGTRPEEARRAFDSLFRKPPG